MYVIRETVHCKPGQVGQMVKKFKAIGAAMRDLGHEPFRLLTDVSGQPFWTLVAETSVERIDDFFALEEKLMASDAIRGVMAGYHDLVNAGKREIYRVES
jgi:hypothetical protein